MRLFSRLARPCPTDRSRAPRPAFIALASSWALLFGCAGTGDLSSTPPAPLETEAAPVALDYDAELSRELASRLRRDADGDLAYRKPVRASNVRGDNARFTPSALTDGDEETYWTTDESVTSAHATVEFGEPTTFDHVILQEHVGLGLRVAAWSLWVRRAEEWTEVASGKAIGEERTVAIEKTTASALRLSIDSAQGCPVIDSIEVFAAP